MRFGFLLSVLVLSGCAHHATFSRAERSFQFGRDTFAFANETVWQYDQGQRLQKETGRIKEEKYSRRCFVMSRASLQFWKFAHFEPRASKLSSKVLAERIRLITRREVWREPLSPTEKIVIPGYVNLHEFSRQEGSLLRQHSFMVNPVLVIF